MKFMIPISSPLHELVVIVSSPRHILLFKLMPFVGPLLRCKLGMLIADMLELIHGDSERHKGYGLLKVRESVFVGIFSKEPLCISVSELLHTHGVDLSDISR